MTPALKRRLFIFLLLVLLVGAAFFSYWFFKGRFFQSTENAYVYGDIVRVSSQLDARIEQVLVNDNELVKQGQLLLTLEDQDFRYALQQAQANLAMRQADLAQAQSRLTEQHDLITAKQAEVNASSADLARIQLDLKRASTLRGPGYVSEERVTSLTADERVASARLSQHQAQLSAQRQQSHTLQAEIDSLNAQVSGAQAELAQAELNLSRTKILAPQAGLVGQRVARIGQVVEAGSHLLALVPNENLWVQANFKETQIEKMQPGQRATLTFDSFPDTPIEAQIDSLFAASGAQFSLLPPDNATGNFTKVVQRIPVKLTFSNDSPLQGKIRPGMSVTVNVDLRTSE